AVAQTVISATDPRIQYSRTWETPAICQYLDDGSLDPGQPGCYNFGSNPCADNFTMARQPGASATLKFRGTAISIENINQPVGGPTLVTFNLDGTDETSNLAPVAGPLTCPDAIFKQDGLDAGNEHTISITLRAPPISDQPDDSVVIFALKQFTITGGDASGPGSSSSSPSHTSSPGSGSQTGGSTPSSTPNMSNSESSLSSSTSSVSSPSS
ncbi:hypothetical protein BKA62DRAFT_606411, partial [Auriculariales sp. MPI-PUGE-AT-0066]